MSPTLPGDGGEATAPGTSSGQGEDNRIGRGEENATNAQQVCCFPIIMPTYDFFFYRNCTFLTNTATFFQYNDILNCPVTLCVRGSWSVWRRCMFYSIQLLDNGYAERGDATLPAAVARTKQFACLLVGYKSWRNLLQGTIDWFVYLSILFFNLLATILL